MESKCLASETRKNIIINPVRWIHSAALGCIIIGVFFSAGERDHLQGQQNCGNFFSDDHENLLSFFPWLLSGVDGEGKKTCIKYNHPTPFICLWKSTAKIFYFFFFLPRRPPDPFKLCSRCTQRDIFYFLFFCYSSNTSPRPAIKRPRTLNTVLPCHWRWTDTVTDEHLAAE